MPASFYRQRATAFAAKILQHLRVLRKDPELFGRNLSQFTHPALFEARLDPLVPTPQLHTSYDSTATPRARLNVLQGAWSQLGMTGGPNTVLTLAAQVARQGVPVRFVATATESTISQAWLQNHLRTLAGGDSPMEAHVDSACTPDKPLRLGPGDMFLATHWSTAAQIGEILPHMAVRQFFYLIQDWEPGFYAWSSNYARALETLSLDFWPIFNERFLAEFVFTQPYGRCRDAETRKRAVVFEPAVDAQVFHPPCEPSPPSRRLLFYARPTNPRNMFGLGLAALRRASRHEAFAGWEFVSIGGRGSLPDIRLPGGQTLQRAPWVDYRGYGDLLRSADILLCPMLSPHTSYPVLEMAACGGLCVTNSFATKSAAALSALSANILASEPTEAAFADTLIQAATLSNAGRPRSDDLDLLRDWPTALDPAARHIADTLHAMLAAAGR